MGSSAPDRRGGAVLRAAHCISLMSLFAAGLNRPLGPYNFTGHIGFKMQCAARNVEGLVKRRSRFRRRARDCCAFRCGGRHSDCGGEQHHKSQNRSRESFDTFHFCSSFQLTISSFGFILSSRQNLSRTAQKYIFIIYYAVRLCQYALKKRTFLSNITHRIHRLKF